MQNIKNQRNSISKSIRKFALDQGFDLIGFSQIKPNAEAYNHYKKWLGKKFEADMLYMSKKEAILKRKSAANLLKNAKSVISLAVNYYHPQPPLQKGHGRIARYAYGRDYHKIIKKKLEAVEDFIKTKSDTAQTLSYVDTGPILERTFAVQAGLGFIGKNSCLITKEFGSWVFLAEIITDLEISSSPGTHSGQPEETSNPGIHSLQPRGMSNPGICGTCARCIDACPTKAITRDKNGKYFINAKRCLSYLTIEYKGPASRISRELKYAISKTKRIFGCDICQEVCPHNCRPKITTHKEFSIPKIASDSISIKKILSIKNEEEFVKLFAGSPLMRAKLKSLRRNAKVFTKTNT